MQYANDTMLIMSVYPQSAPESEEHPDFFCIYWFDGELYQNFPSRLPLSMSPQIDVRNLLTR